MLAVDTNVVVRFLTGDDPAQSGRAIALFERHVVLLPKTVLLEAEWVLRSLYGFSSDAIASALEALIALPNVRCEDMEAASCAVAWMRQGLDFADALHLASSGRAGRFATFDEKLVKRAKALADIEMVNA